MRTANLLTALLVSAAMYSVQAVESEFGNDCTMGLAAKQHVATACSIDWVGEDGKRYCFGTEAAKAQFLKDPKGNLEKARAFRGIFGLGRTGWPLSQLDAASAKGQSFSVVWSLPAVVLSRIAPT